MNLKRITRNVTAAFMALALFSCTPDSDCDNEANIPSPGLPFVPTMDVTLEGDFTVKYMIIRSGVTVTLTGDLNVIAEEDMIIDGAIIGDSDPHSAGTLNLTAMESIDINGSIDLSHDSNKIDPLTLITTSFPAVCSGTGEVELDEFIGSGDYECSYQSDTLTGTFNFIDKNSNRRFDNGTDIVIEYMPAAETLQTRAVSVYATPRDVALLADRITITGSVTASDAGNNYSHDGGDISITANTINLSGAVLSTGDGAPYPYSSISIPYFGNVVGYGTRGGDIIVDTKNGAGGSISISNAFAYLGSAGAGGVISGIANQSASCSSNSITLNSTVPLCGPRAVAGDDYIGAVINAICDYSFALPAQGGSFKLVNSGGKQISMSNSFIEIGAGGSAPFYNITIPDQADDLDSCPIDIDIAEAAGGTGGTLEVDAPSTASISISSIHVSGGTGSNGASILINGGKGGDAAASSAGRSSIVQTNSGVGGAGAGIDIPSANSADFIYPYNAFAGGDGGSIYVTGANGGDSIYDQSITGGDAATILASAQNGGSGGILINSLRVLAVGGAGGGITVFNAGNGGAGFEDCNAVDAPPGGIGGNGGTANLLAGDGGLSPNSVIHTGGDLTMISSFNGGKGGDGNPPGAGGDAGVEVFAEAGRGAQAGVVVSMNSLGEGNIGESCLGRKLTFDILSNDFENVEIGSFKGATVGRLTNVSNERINVVLISVTEPFYIRTPAPFTLEPLATKDVEVIFLPEDDYVFYGNGAIYAQTVSAEDIEISFTTYGTGTSPTYEAIEESEVNDTREQADPLGDYTKAKGNLPNSDDIDYFVKRLLPGRYMVRSLAGGGDVFIEPTLGGSRIEGESPQYLSINVTQDVYLGLYNGDSDYTFEIVFIP